MSFKKILFLTHAGDPGGAEYKMIGFCKKINIENHVTYMSQGSMGDILTKENIPHSLVEMPSEIQNFSRSSGLSTGFKLIPHVIKTIRKLYQKTKQFDAIVCMSQKAFLFCALAKLFSRKPIIWFMNDTLSSDYFSNFSIKIIKILSKIFADIVIVNSQASLQAWHDHQATPKVDVIYSGIDDQKFQTSIAQNQDEIAQLRTEFTKNDRKAVCIVGRISSWKGQHVLLQAALLNTDINAIIIGDAFFDEKSYEKDLHNFIKMNKLEERVIFTGHVDDPVLYMSACDIVTHCSTIAEPFGRVIVEANLAGKPVIATDGGGAKEIIIDQETGLLTPMGNAAALARAMDYLISNPEQAEIFTKNAKKRALENYTLDISAKKLDEVLYKLSSNNTDTKVEPVTTQ